MNGKSKMKKKSNKIKMKSKIGGGVESHTRANEVYDTELRCANCGTPLYVSPEGATLVASSLRAIGVAGLVCLCGHIQYIDAALRPLAVPMQKRRHD